MCLPRARVLLYWYLVDAWEINRLEMMAGQLFSCRTKICCKENCWNAQIYQHVVYVFPGPNVTKMGGWEGDSGVVLKGLGKLQQRDLCWMPRAAEQRVRSWNRSFASSEVRCWGFRQTHTFTALWVPSKSMPPSKTVPLTAGHIPLPYPHLYPEKTCEWRRS